MRLHYGAKGCLGLLTNGFGAIVGLMHTSYLVLVLVLVPVPVLVPVRVCSAFAVNQ